MLVQFYVWTDGTNDIVAAAMPGEVLLKVGDSVGGTNVEREIHLRIPHCRTGKIS